MLRAAGVAFTPGEDALRPARLLALFREDLPLEHFDRDLLRGTRGWDAAFAAAISDLEAAGLSPSDLPEDGAQARDVALLWSRVAADAATSFSAARTYLEAAALLARDPRAWPFDGPVLALATGHEDVARARFLAAAPALTLALRPAHPVTARDLWRVERLYGSQARDTLVSAPSSPAPEAGAPERELLAAFLFADAKVLAARDRPRSRGPDGTVELEEHAGVEAELEATAAFVARQVLEARRPLEDVAVLEERVMHLVSAVADADVTHPDPVVGAENFRVAQSGRHSGSACEIPAADVVHRNPFELMRTNSSLF